jgi:hypothetical protein
MPLAASLRLLPHHAADAAIADFLSRLSLLTLATEFTLMLRHDYCRFDAPILSPIFA